MPAVLARRSSGVTIGIGCDLGYTTQAEFMQDWAMLGAADKARLAACIGLTGADSANIAIAP